MKRRNLHILVLLAAASFAGAAPASAETIAQALAAAYANNPSINAQRAATRATDENVPIARGGLRPIVSAFSNLSGQSVSRKNIGTSDAGSATIGLQVQQNLFQGFRVKNSILESEAGVLASRELLRNQVQNTLFDAAQAYFNVIRFQAVLDISRRSVLFLQEQVRAAQERFNVGENTSTDVAQARASLASSRASVALAIANLAGARATYRQIVGHDPGNLISSFPYARLIPAKMEGAISVGLNGHPVILAAIHQTDAQAFSIKQAEGALLPTVSVQGTVQHTVDLWNSEDSDSASITGNVSVPLYQGGIASARVRQAKELYSQQKLQIDLARDQVRAAVQTAWATSISSRDSISSANEGISAAELALSGVQEEQGVGQATTLDVLTQQQTLLNARQTLITAQFNQSVAAYSLLSAMGRLTAEKLHLATPVYDPVEHYQAVEKKLYGVRTPDGR